MPITVTDFSDVGQDISTATLGPVEVEKDVWVDADGVAIDSDNPIVVVVL